jgi:hypothetical protein
MNTKEKLTLAVGDRYVALPGSEMHRTCHALRPIEQGEKCFQGDTCFRLDERHPCGALEFVVIEAPTP